jgi:23S rRNA pseudouridine2605 synthase
MTDRQAEDRSGHRIAKLLARAGVASRREIERMIAEGRVALDGKVLDTPATVLKSLRGVTVDGNPVEAAAPARLFIYHKPPGLLVTERDPAGRPTIYDRLPPDLPRVVPVGRLDLATEGLLLLTTDGALKRTLELPATGVERAYRARAYGEVTQAMLEELIEGVEIEGVRYGPIDANLERRTGANVWIELILTEGKNREVRRVLEHLGLQVSRLIRTRYGPFILGDLPAGGVGEVRQHDLIAFTKSLKDGRPTDARVEAIEPRTATRRARAAEPTASSKGRTIPSPSVTPDASRASAGHKQKGSGRAAPRAPEHGFTDQRRIVRDDDGNGRPARAVRPEATPALPRPGFRAAKASTSARSVRSAAFAERSHRERADDRAEAPARAGRPAAAGGRGRSTRTTTPGDAPARPRGKGDDLRPGRTGPRAERPARAAREGERSGSAGGWPDRPLSGGRSDRARPTTPRPDRTGPSDQGSRADDNRTRPSTSRPDRAKPGARPLRPDGDRPCPSFGGTRSKPTTPRRPDDGSPRRGPPRGKR